METDDKYTINVVYNDYTDKFKREVAASGIRWTVQKHSDSWIDPNDGWIGVNNSEVFEAIYQAGVSKGKRGQHEKQADRQQVS